MIAHELAILVAAAKLLKREGYTALGTTVEGIAKDDFNAQKRSEQ